MTRFQRLTGVFITALYVVISGGSAYAQSTTSATANGFRISPIRNEVTVEKGKSATVSIMVENPSSLPFKAKAVINDFVASDKEDGEPRLLLDGTSAPSHSLRKLVQDIPNIDFAPNERKEIPVTITIPTNAAAGGYYGAVRFLPANSTNGSNINLAASVGSLFLVNVPGNIKEHLFLEQFGAAVSGTIKNIITGGQVSIITRLKNDGDTHEKPFGKIQIKDSKGKLIVEQEINNDEPRANILPNSIRKFETKISNKKWLGHYTVTGSFGYEPSSGDLINAKTSFWYIPIWLLIAFFVIVIAIIVAGYTVYHKAQMRRHHRNSQKP